MPLRDSIPMGRRGPYVDISCCSGIVDDAIVVDGYGKKVKAGFGISYKECTAKQRASSNKSWKFWTPNGDLSPILRVRIK